MPVLYAYKVVVRIVFGRSDAYEMCVAIVHKYSSSLDARGN